MGKKGAKKAGGNKSNSSSGSVGGGFSTLDVDPRCVRYAHSKIKPLFSGCGRTIEETLCEIRDGKTRASDLPMITVLLGPMTRAEDGQEEHCFFSLNNRRLFVFKECREEGLLGPSGLVKVRARSMKANERERYTVERCSLQAKFLFAPKPKTNPSTQGAVSAETEESVEVLSSLSLSAELLSTDDQVAEVGVQTACKSSLSRATDVAEDRGAMNSRR